MIKVSVIVPAYNVEKYIGKCLAALARQTLSDIEVLVVNDGSQDDSQRIIDEFVKRYPHIFKSFVKPNGGLSDARNYGIPHCRGEYIGFVDSDDYVEPDMFEKMYDEAKKIDADIVVCDYLKEYETESRLVKARVYKSSKDMFLGGLAAAWNKIYKRVLIEKTGVLFPKGLIYEDTEFFCKLIPHVSVCGYVNRAFVHYVQRAGSITNSQGKKVAMIFDIFDGIIAYYKENAFYESYKDELTYFATRVLLGSSMERICRCENASDRKELLERTMEYLDDRFGCWRKNRYLAGWADKRNIYMRNMRQWNIRIVAIILRRHFLKLDKRLF